MQTIPAQPAPFSLERGICGPASLFHILRFCSVYGLLVVIGFGITQYALHPQWQIFGLGMMFPGAGFLAHAGLTHLSGILHILYAFLSFGIFCGSLFLWFATGNIIAPILTYIIITLVATTMRHGIMGYAVPWLLLWGIMAAAIVGILFAFIRHTYMMRRRLRLNDNLQSDAANLLPSWQQEAERPTPELSIENLALMRFLLDRALQPLDGFDGFEWLDQYQTAAVRYQLSFMGYALSLAHARFTPAFQGYSANAQKNLILKQSDHRIWSYWEKENLWGNLDRNPDPGARENIMYTGFCALQIAMYQKATGQNTFDDKNEFILHHPSGLKYRYAMTDFLQSIIRETGKSSFYLASCEPNWIYPICNSIGMSAIKSYRPDTWALHETPFRTALEQEFVNAKGHFISCRSRRMGFALPDIGGALAQALPCFFFNLLFPDIALRHWLTLRRSIFKNGQLTTAAFWPIDIGNYGMSRAAAYTATALAAAEMGDQDIRKHCLTALERECPATHTDTGFYRLKASVWAHAVEFAARTGAKEGFKNLMLRDKKNTATPHIAWVNYHQVNVAAAHYLSGKLTAIFYPRYESGYYKVRFSGLRPLSAYQTEYGDVTASHDGKAEISCPMNGRTALTLCPIEKG